MPEPTKRQRTDVMGWKDYKNLLPEIHPEICPRLCGLIQYTGDRRKNRRAVGWLHYTTDETITLKHETGYSVIRWDELTSKSYRRALSAEIGDFLRLVGLTMSPPHERTDHYLPQEETSDDYGC